MTVMDKPRRWQRRKAARPQEILEAALAVFTEKGFAKARMEDIAEAAGVTKGTIYLYFAHKEAVLEGLIQDAIGTRIDVVEAALAGSALPASELIRLVMAVPAEILSSDDPRIAIPMIVLKEAGNFPDLALFYRRAVIDRGLSLLAGLIARGIAAGEFRPVNPEHAARLCFAPFLLALAWRTAFARFDAEPYDYKSFIQSHYDVLMHGLAAEAT